MFNRANASAPWDSSNAAAFLEYTAQQNYSIYGFELGNELTTKVSFICNYFVVFYLSFYFILGEF